LRIGVDLDFIASLAKEFDGFANIAGSKNAEFVLIGFVFLAGC